jgi:hypothetical protein
MAVVSAVSLVIPAAIARKNVAAAREARGVIMIAAPTISIGRRYCSRKYDAERRDPCNAGLQ